MASSLTVTRLPVTPSPSPATPTKSSRHPPRRIPAGIGVGPRRRLSIKTRTAIRASDSGAAASSSPSPGLYSAQKFELTVQNVDLVLEDVRPYLIADGGNVDVVSVEDGIVSLQLQ
ncbi:hypothetical protein CRG98_035117, partial [Punica granatum]